MSMKIYSDNSIEIDGVKTKFKVTQRASGTVVYSTSHTGHDYQEFLMPFGRYSTAHDSPHKAGELYDPKKCAGKSQFETDVRALI